MRADIIEKLQQTLGGFVNRGGTVYASDLRYGLITRSLPERAPLLDFNLRPLRDIEDAEKRWFRTVLPPSTNVATVAQTLDKLPLSEPLRARRDPFLAALNLSELVKIYKQAGDPDDLTTVRALTERYDFPATEADFLAIAAAFERHRTAIQELIAGRSKTKLTKMRGELNRIESILKESRERLVLECEGTAPQEVDAQVEDPGLKELIGASIRLRFPLSAWDAGRFSGQGQILIRGTYVTVLRQSVEAPLLVRFRQGKGTVIFTSFHNEAQNNEQELKLLRYLVFSAATAKEEALAQETMLAGGFSPVKEGQVNHAAGEASITKTYQSTSGDPLRFSLNFGGGGAILRLTLVAPGGQEYKQDTDETLVVQATGAPAGEWLYTVTAVKVPYPNFAYSVSIGKGGAAGQPGRR